MQEKTKRMLLFLSIWKCKEKYLEKRSRSSIYGENVISRKSANIRLTDVAFVYHAYLPETQAVLLMMEAGG